MVHLVHEYFERSADRFPDKVAIGCDDDEITYKDLDEYTNGVAHYLIGEGVERGMLVPLFIEKNINAYKAFIGILKADCTYVPLDTDAPVAKLKPVLEQCDTKFILVDDNTEAHMQEIIEEFGMSVRVINVEQIPIENTERRTYENISIDMVYVIFTSGSTGVPKGVMMSHFQVVDYIDFCVDLYEVTDKDVVSQGAPLYFDNSVLDIYCAFSAGARLELVYRELNVMIPKLASWLRDKKISMFLAVPSMLTMLLKSRRLKPDMLPNMRNVIFSGEVIQPEIIAEWMKLYPHANYTNMYGPTEITVDCTYHRLTKPPEPEDGPVSIGKARPNMETFVRLDNGELSQEPGAEGELLIRGLAVGYGYLKNKEKTEKVFIQNPLHDVYHDPLYCSGDRVRLADNGDIMFLGRIDFQIKLRGNRIEPGEIEAALVGLDAVREAVVVYHHSPNPTEAAIGAMMSKAINDDVADDDFIRDVRERLTDTLPDYMIPAVMGVMHEDFPLTPAGKYDRREVLARLFD